MLRDVRWRTWPGARSDAATTPSGSPRQPPAAADDIAARQKRYLISMSDPHGVLRRRGRRRAAGWLAVADPDRRRAGAAVRRGRDGQRRRSRRPTASRCVDRPGRPELRRAGDRGRADPRGFRRRRRRAESSAELGLPRRSARCRTASPVAVRHLPFRDSRGAPLQAERARTSARPRAARRPPSGRCCGTTPSCTRPSGARPGWPATSTAHVARRRSSARAASCARSSPRAEPAVAGPRLATRRAQPPMADIGRSGCRNVGSSMPCPARLVAHRARASGRRSPRRRRRRAAAARRSDSSRANRQLRTWPSAVSRTRSQSPQNGRVTEAITPTVCRAAVDERTARPGALPRGSLGRASSANSRAQRGEDLVGGDHRRRGSSRAGRRAASAR